MKKSKGRNANSHIGLLLGSFFRPLGKKRSRRSKLAKVKSFAIVVGIVIALAFVLWVYSQLSQVNFHNYLPIALAMTAFVCLFVGIDHDVRFVFAKASRWWLAEDIEQARRDLPNVPKMTDDEWVQHLRDTAVGYEIKVKKVGKPRGAVTIESAAQRVKDIDDDIPF